MTPPPPDPFFEPLYFHAVKKRQFTLFKALKWRYVGSRDEQTQTHANFFSKCVDYLSVLSSLRYAYYYV